MVKMNKSENLIFNTRDELLRIGLSKIVYFESDGNYTHIMTVNKLNAVICMSLSEMECLLTGQLGEAAKQFARVGKRFIINKEYIYLINPLKQTLILSDYDHFAFKLGISKDALRKMKDDMRQAQLGAAKKTENEQETKR